MRRAGFLGLAAVALGACGGEGGSREPTYYGDVESIVAASCVGCHHEGGVAPMPLTRYEQVAAFRDEIRRAVRDRTMPPWLAGPHCDEYAQDRSLTDEEAATITEWVDRGAPTGEAPNPVRLARKDSPGLSRVDLRLEMPTEYEPSEHPEERRCFLLDWEEERTTYVTGFRANPGTPQIVRRVDAYLVSPNRADDYRALDGREPGPGWSCFGGTGDEHDFDATWLGGWTPGGVGGDFPAGTGIRVEPGSEIVLRVHYDTSLAGPTVDRTSVELSIEPSVQREAMWLPWTDPLWVSEGRMPLPPGEPDVTRAYSLDPASSMALVEDAVVVPNEPFLIHAVGVRMHGRGTRAILSTTRTDGYTDCLLHVPRWDLAWPQAYAFERPKRVEPGDEIRIECHWDTTDADEERNWGESANDERCLGFLYASTL